MRILLIVPTLQYDVAYPSYLSVTNFPTGFAYLAASLTRAGHEVFGVNPNNDPSFSSSHHLMRAKLSRAISDYDPELIAVGGLCTDYLFLTDAMRLIRDQAPDTPVVMGGGIINNDAPVVFPLLRPDFCIVGEGEEAIVNLAAALERGGHDYRTIANLGYWENGKGVFTERNNKYCEINSLPFPDYSPFEIDSMLDDHSMATPYFYRYTRPQPRPMVLVSARSCPFSCTFCVHTHGTPYRTRSMDNIFAEIRHSYERYRFNVLILVDELFAASKRRLDEFCERMIELRGKERCDFDWVFQTHANANLDRESLIKAKEAGCYFFSYGIESASPSVLASMKKKSSPDQIRRAVKLSEEVAIGFGGNFIFGDLAETATTVEESLKFVCDHCTNAHVFFAEVKTYPGSEIFEWCVRQGIIQSRVNYYQNASKKSYNMTSMPDSEWQETLRKIYSLAGTDFRFAKSAQIARVVWEAGNRNGSRRWPGKRAVTVWAICPHCRREFRYYDMVDVAQAEIGAVSLVTGCTGCHRRVRLLIEPVKAMLADPDPHGPRCPELPDGGCAESGSALTRESRPDAMPALARNVMSSLIRKGSAAPWAKRTESSLGILPGSPQHLMPYPGSDKAARWGLLGVFLSHIYSLTPHGQGMKLLDIGCGKGWTTHLANSYGVCDGLDPSQELVEVARRRFPDIGFHSGTAAEFAEAHENAYDVLICFDGIEHLAGGDKQSFAAALARLICSWGYLLLAVPCREIQYYRGDRQCGSLCSENGSSESGVRSLFSRYGFVAVNKETVGHGTRALTAALTRDSVGVFGESETALHQVWVFRYDPTSAQPAGFSNSGPDIAESDVDELAGVDLDLVDSCFSLASAARRRGDDTEALLIAKLALDRIPAPLWTAMPQALLTYLAASAAETVGDSNTAAMLFSRLASESAAMPATILAGVHYHLARIYESLGEVADARHHAARCLVLAPDHSAAVVLRGRLVGSD